MRCNWPIVMPEPHLFIRISLRYLDVNAVILGNYFLAASLTILLCCSKPNCMRVCYEYPSLKYKLDFTAHFRESSAERFLHNLYCEVSCQNIA